jgi:enoyl-CoA hydratase
MSAVGLSVEGGIARLTLDRPERHNAFDAALKDAFAGAVDEIARRNDVRCVLLAGTGPSFCSGADLKMLGELDAARARAFMIEATLAFRRLEKVPAPVIGVIHGFCLGGGFELALHCDLLLASDDAVFGLPEAGLGLITTAGCAARLLATVGAMRARDLLLTARRLSAPEAEQMGLVAQVAARDRLEVVAAERAKAIAALPTAGVAAMKALVARSLEPALAAGWIAEVETFESLVRARRR